MLARFNRLPPIGMPWRAIIKVRAIESLQVTDTTVCTFTGFLHSLFECDPYRAEVVLHARASPQMAHQKRT
jgi:hypothetical protein